MHDLEIQFRVNLISAQETKENNLSSVHIVQWREGVRAFLYPNMSETGSQSLWKSASHIWEHFQCLSARPMIGLETELSLSGQKQHTWNIICFLKSRIWSLSNARLRYNFWTSIHFVKLKRDVQSRFLGRVFLVCFPGTFLSDAKTIASTWHTYKMHPFP